MNFKVQSWKQSGQTGGYYHSLVMKCLQLESVDPAMPHILVICGCCLWFTAFHCGSFSTLSSSVERVSFSPPYLFPRTSEVFLHNPLQCLSYVIYLSHIFSFRLDCWSHSWLSLKPGFCIICLEWVPHISHTKMGRGWVGGSNPRATMPHPESYDAGVSWHFLQYYPFYHFCIHKLSIYYIFIYFWLLMHLSFYP